MIEEVAANSQEESSMREAIRMMARWLCRSPERFRSQQRRAA